MNKEYFDVSVFIKEVMICLKNLLKWLISSTVEDSLKQMNPAYGLLVLSIVTLKGAFKINELIKCNKK